MTDGQRALADVPGPYQGPLWMPSPEAAVVLTGREVQLLQLLDQGWPNQRIAEHLSLTLGTTKQYLHRLFSKLGVQNRLQAVLAGKRLHLLA